MGYPPHDDTAPASEDPGFPAALPGPGAGPDGDLYLDLDGAMSLSNALGNVALPRSRPARAILGLLAAAPGRRLSRTRLASLIWRNSAPPDALNSLRNALHKLRTVLREQGLDIVWADQHAVWIDDARMHLIRRPSGMGEMLAEFDDPVVRSWVQARVPQSTAAQPGPAGGGPRPLPGGPAAPAPQAPTLRVEPIAATRGLRPADAADIVQEELVAALSRLRWIGIAAGTPAPDSPAAYRLAPSLRAMGERLRLNVSLIDDRRHGLVLWTDRFELDAAAADLIAEAEEAAARVAAQLDGALLTAEAQTIGARPDAEMSGYGLAIRAVPGLLRLEETGFRAAGELLYDAVALDPDCCLAHVLHAYWHVFNVGQSWSPDPAVSLARAERLAERGLFLDPSDARALSVAAHVRAFLRRDLTSALLLHEKALDANRGLPLAWGLAGVASVYAGELATARTRLQRSLALAPSHPHAFFAETGLALVAVFEGDFVAAAQRAARVRLINPRFSAARVVELAALGQLGQRQEAADLIRELKTVVPRFNLRDFRARAPYRRESDLDRLVAGLERAGLR